MANNVLDVGTGVIVIAVVWIAALLFGMMLLRTSAKLTVIPVFLLALIITLTLVFFPRSPETPPPFKEIEIVDTLFIGRYVLLAIVSVTFLVALFMLIPFHFLEPIYAKDLKTH
ncbi:transmembrane protein 218 [Sphaeramia orbicularis]|uniref:Transmembrane protein 218 n=1 Tax=Sphaeramia orbicularis TaxID=375764 RepID=A0A673A9M2_9TELE|nr:transmembrane protein 218 [Sphaeramia orbicularis]